MHLAARFGCIAERSRPHGETDSPIVCTDARKEVAIFATSDPPPFWGWGSLQSVSSHLLQQEQRPNQWCARPPARTRPPASPYSTMRPPSMTLPPDRCRDAVCLNLHHFQRSWALWISTHQHGHAGADILWWRGGRGLSRASRMSWEVSSGGACASPLKCRILIWGVGMVQIDFRTSPYPQVGHANPLACLGRARDDPNFYLCPKIRQNAKCVLLLSCWCSVRGQKVDVL